MKILLLIVLTVSCTLAPFSLKAKEAPPMTIDQQAVLKTIKSMTDAFHSSDIEGVMETYEPAPTIVFEPGKPVSDSEVLKQMFQGAFSLNPQFEYGDHDVFIADDIALHLTPWTMAGKTPDGQSVEQKGLSIAVLRKQPNGEWLMVIDNPHGQILFTDQ